MEEKCFKCGAKLNNKKIVWLKLDVATNIFHEIGTVLEEKSQGAFPFGKDCAEKIKDKELT